jgi:hypothetical protein
MSDTRQPLHPAPHRRYAGRALGFALLAAPLAWLVQTSANYGLASHACYPAAEPLHMMTGDWQWPVVLVVNIAAIVLATVAALIAFFTWRRTREEAAGEVPALIEAGEGRTRFLSLWGSLTGAGLAIGLLFSLIALLGVPPCGYP